MVLLRTIKDASIKKGTRVLLRADFDVPVKGGCVIDDYRIRAVLPTIKLVLKKRGYLRIMAKRGRPGGKLVPELSLRVVAKYLERVLRKRVIFISKPLEKNVIADYRCVPEILFFENIRFWPGEEKNSFAFASALASYGDIYVNEDFANAHRNHASIVALAKILPSYAGLSFSREVKYLELVWKKSRKPLVAILGGSKLETKLPLVRRFLRHADYVLLGGVLANTFLAVDGARVGRSFRERGVRHRLFSLLKNPTLKLPTDVITVKSMGRRVSSWTIKPVGMVDKEDYIVDIGPKTLHFFASLIKRARAVVWNGPLGYVENPLFIKNTRSLARLVGGVKAFKVVGGGDTIAALHRGGLLKGFNHVSTGGGAMLELLAGKKLPGIEVLKK